MRVIIDTEQQTVSVAGPEGNRELALYSPEGFGVVNEQWLRVGWALKYSYAFTWMGRPIVQLPEDLLRIQELVFSVRPDVIVETGVAHGGSLIFYASLCKVLGRGRVVGVDIDIRPHNRQAIARHALAPYITLLQGSATDLAVVAQVRQQIRPNERVLVVLDSCHTKQHVLDELELYSPLVSVGSYIVATDGVMGDLGTVPGGQTAWNWDNPRAAALEFARSHSTYRLEDPPLLFCETPLRQHATYWPGGYLKRVA
jgi:cephalosporin hydroxylase